MIFGVTMLTVQIHIDIPRMCPLIPLFQQTAIQQVVWQFDYLLTDFCLCLVFIQCTVVVYWVTGRASGLYLF